MVCACAVGWREKCIWNGKRRAAFCGVWPVPRSCYRPASLRPLRRMRSKCWHLTQSARLTRNWCLSLRRQPGHHVLVEWSGTPDIVRRAKAGEVVDVVVIPAGRVDELVAHGNAVERTDLARPSIGLAAKANSPQPVAATTDDLRRFLLTVRFIVLSSGPSGEYMHALFERLGVSGDIKQKVLQLAPGLSVGEAIAEGRGDLGFTQISELLAITGIAYLGPLPADVQSVTVFSAGLLAPRASSGAARALIRFLAGPDATFVFRNHGLEPG